MASRTLQFVGTIWQGGDMYTACCPELDLATRGHTVEEARRNRREVIEIFLEETGDGDAPGSARRDWICPRRDDAGTCLPSGCHRSASSIPPDCLMPRIAPTDWRTQARIFEAYGCVFMRQKGDSGD